MMLLRSKRMALIVSLLALAFWLVACAAPAPNDADAVATVAPGEETAMLGAGGSAIGFLFVGPRDDFGYNQAAYLGSEAVGEAFGQYELLRAENVPENQEAERVMENMIRNGAKIIFPTSYGHLDPALAVAERPEQIVALLSYVIEGRLADIGG